MNNRYIDPSEYNYPKYQKRYENLSYKQKMLLYKQDRALHDELKADYIRRRNEIRDGNHLTNVSNSDIIGS